MPDQRTVRLKNYQGVTVLPVGGKAAILFGLPFLAAGVFPLLIATESIEVDPRSIHAPLWVIGAVGVLFSVVGLFVMVQGVRGELRRLARDRRMALHPGLPWHADSVWDPAGCDEDRRGRAGSSIMGSLIFALFGAIPFGLRERMPPPIFWIIAVVMSLLTAWCIGYTIYVVGATLKYRKGHLRFSTFPFFLGERLEASLQAPAQLARFRDLRFTLRFVAGRVETGANRHGQRTTSLIHEQLYADSYQLQCDVDLPRDMAEMPISFEIPDDPGFESKLSEHPARYWELEVSADAPGIDYRARFVLPIYGNPARPAASETVCAASIETPAGV